MFRRNKTGNDWSSGRCSHGGHYPLLYWIFSLKKKIWKPKISRHCSCPPPSRKMLREEVLGPWIHGYWGMVITIIITVSSSHLWDTFFSARHCANLQRALTITQKKGITLSIVQVKELGFRKLKEVAQGQTDKCDSKRVWFHMSIQHD